MTPDQLGFYNALKAHRRGMTPQQRKKAPKLSPFLYPWAAEKAYARAIEKALAPMGAYVLDYLKRNSVDILRGDSRQDGLPGPGYTLMGQTLGAYLDSILPTNGLSGGSQLAVVVAINDAADAVEDSFDKQWAKMMDELLGSNYLPSQAWWVPAKTTWAAYNYKLIKSVGIDYITQINAAVEKAVLNGTSASDLRDIVQDITGHIKWKAARIARDQVGKLNGMITQKRLTDIGVNQYDWMTAGDERVRGAPGGRYKKAIPSHYVMDGKRCTFEDSEVWSLDGGKTFVKRAWNAPKENPGIPIQCRCTALPHVGDLIAQIDREIDEEGGAAA